MSPRTTHHTLDELMELMDEDDRSFEEVPDAMAVAPEPEEEKEDEGEDEGLESTIRNILDTPKASSASRRKTALGHFNDFLQEYWKFLVSNEAREDPAPGTSNTLWDRIDIEDLNIETFGRFATYLAEKAMNKRDLTRGQQSHLSLNSAMGYFSSVKSFYSECYVVRNSKTTPKVFTNPTWQSLNRKLSAQITERHKRTGKPLVQPKIAANTDDWKALASICVWHGSTELLEFWPVFVCLTHMAARVNEAAFLRFSDVKPTVLEGPHNTQNIVGLFTVNNYKQSSMQTMHVFPHIKLWQLDLFFSLAVFYSVAGPMEEDYLFPRYGERAQRESAASAAKDSSKIVSLFTDALRKCEKWFNENKSRMIELQDLPDSLTKGLCSHSGKKYAVRAMGRELNPIYVVFRAGWEVRNSHTLFDYLVKDIVHDVKAAKICAGWHTPWFGDIFGGFNLKVEDLQEEIGKFPKFCAYLFPYHTDRLDQEIINLLGLSVLRFYSDFVCCVRSNPMHNGSEPTHQFVSAVESAYRNADVSPELFQKWQENAEKMFKAKNCYAFSVKDAPAAAVDARPMFERMAQMEEVVKEAALECTTLRASIEKLLVLSGEQLAKINRLEALMAANPSASQHRSPVTNHGTSAPVTPDNSNIANPQDSDSSSPNPFPGTLPTNMCYDDLFKSRYKDKQVPVTKIFVAWFVEQLPVTYENYKAARQQNPARTDSKFHKKVKNHFSIVKTTIHVVLKNLSEYPAKRLSHLPRELEALAIDALEKIKEKHGIKCKGLPTKSHLAGKPSSVFNSAKYEDIDFPAGTPPSVQMYFKARDFRGRGIISEESLQMQEGDGTEVTMEANVTI